MMFNYFLDSRGDCVEQFGQEANMAITQDDQVLCVTEYSRIVPLENGEVNSFGRLQHQRLKNGLEVLFGALSSPQEVRV